MRFPPIQLIQRARSLPLLAALFVASLALLPVRATLAGGSGQSSGSQPQSRFNGAPVSGRDRVYTADQTSNTVSVIDPSTNTLLGQIELGEPRPDKLLGPLYNQEINVHGLGYSPDGGTLAVVNVTTNSIQLIDTATNTVRRTVYVGRAPHEAFFTPDGRELWVSVRGEDYIQVLSAEGDPIRRIAVVDGVSKVVFRPDGRYAFASSARVPKLVVIDTRTDRVVRRNKVVSPFSPDLWISPDGEEVWQTHKDVGKVTVTDAHTFRQLHVLDTGKVTNHAQFANISQGEFAYVSIGGENMVKVYRRGGGAPQLIKRIPTGATPHGLWPSADGSRIYVVLEDGDAVQVIDTSSNEVIKTIPIGQMPQALVYVPHAAPSGGGAENLARVRVGLPVVKFKLMIPDKPFPFLPESVGKVEASGVARSLEGVDSLDLMVKGLPPDAEYTVFLSEKATGPFGAVQYVAGFKTDSEGKGEVSVQTIVFDAFALTGSASGRKLDAEGTNATRRELDHVVIWPADPATTASFFTSRGLPAAITPFDEDAKAGAAILTDTNDPTKPGPLSVDGGMPKEMPETGAGGIAPTGAIPFTWRIR